MASAESRPGLYDAAVNRALVYALRLGLPPSDPGKLRVGLELWYLKTRFAYRIPLETVVATLQSHPGGDCHWQGGRTGSWKYETDKNALRDES